MNKILKLGGLAYIHTHQTIGLHDAPWDFFRYSEHCWKSFFNPSTGFEILSSAMDVESFVIPFVFREGKIDAEKSAGFESSAVLVRKVGASDLTWDVDFEMMFPGRYPSGQDSAPPADFIEAQTKGRERDGPFRRFFGLNRK